MGTINHTRVAQSNWAIARECEKGHERPKDTSDEEFPAWMRKPKERTKPLTTDEKWKDGWHNRCKVCYTSKSVNGACMCEE